MRCKCAKPANTWKPGDSYRAYYLPVTPRELPIESIVVHNNTEKRGEILISGITLQLPRGAKPTERLTAFGKRTVMKGDLQPAFATDDIPDFGPKLEALSDILYTSLDDLPKKVERIDFPQGFKGTGHPLPFRFGRRGHAVEHLGG